MILIIAALSYLYAIVGIIICLRSPHWDGSTIGYIGYVFTWPIKLWKGE